jgi:DNA polymerase III delta prime subunit
MKRINLEALNDKEFENLARDLLQEELSKHIESFKSGRDQGIDLRFTTTDKGTTIIQAKHWPNAKISSLASRLKNEEAPKVKLLSPTTYILFTSLPLSPADKEKIKQASQGLIKTPEEIYGYDDIENLLNKHGNIFKKTTKLWLTSVDILERILHNNIDGRSEYSSDSIKRSIRKFVTTTDFQKAKQKLKKLKFLIIKGEPGVGKTTLANILAYHAMADGCTLTKAESIDEIEKSIKPIGKQIFILDDFLGSNFLNIYSENTNGERITKIIERIIEQDGKYIILTSRTTILNKAYSTLHKLESPSHKLAEFEVVVESYSPLDKGKILYNHLYESRASAGHFAEISRNNNYLKIISHKNFNPRIMEFICLKENLSTIHPNKYTEFIFEQLNNPEKIWKNPYQNQLDSEGRFIVDALFSLGNEASKHKLEQAYEGRITYEVKNNGFQRRHIPFEDHLKTLSGSFINLYTSNTDITCKLFTPAIADFLIAHLKANKESRKNIYESAIFSEQLSETMLSKSNKITSEQETIECLFRHSEESQLISANRDSTYLTLAGLAAETEHPDSTILMTKLIQKARYDEPLKINTKLLKSITNKLSEQASKIPSKIKIEASKFLMKAIEDSHTGIDWLLQNASNIESLSPWEDQPQEICERYRESIEEKIYSESSEHISSSLNGVIYTDEALSIAEDAIYELKNLYSRVSGDDYYGSNFWISYDEENVLDEVRRNNQTRSTPNSIYSPSTPANHNELEQLFDIQSWINNISE